MTECPAREQLALLLAEQLSPPEADCIGEHVQACAGCQQALADLSGGNLLGPTRATPGPEPRGEFLRRLRETMPASEHAPGQANGHAPAPVAGWPQVAGYEVLSELGRGGMGVVYQARQVGLNRLVALKMIREGRHAGASEQARFRTEAEAVARLQHPNIVQVYEVGEEDGRPYLALEYVDGGSLADRLRGTPLPADEAARLVEVLARAVDVAHKRGVVHRDLKPANVLLTADGTPKVVDFGLAKRLDGVTPHTQTGAVLGTPDFMAPEQAEGKVVGPAADVHALGALLYQMLTGRPPFVAESALDTLMRVRLEEPVPPAVLQPKTPRDLSTICLKCLQKEPGRRYPSALDLAEDLRRFRHGEPVQARPVGRAGQLWRWCRRNPREAVLIAAVALTLVAGTAVSTALAVMAREQKRLADQRADDAEAEKRRAEQQRDRADWLAYAGKLALAQREWQDKNVGYARALLDACPPQLCGWEHAYLRHLCASDQRTFWGHTREVAGVCWSPDGTRLASADGDGTVKVWDAATGQPVLSFRADRDRVFGVCWSPDGRQLATAGADPTVKVWDAASGREVLALRGHKGMVRSVSWGPDGTHLASAGEDQTVRVWYVPTGQETLIQQGHPGPVLSVCWSPDGRRLASASADGMVKVWWGTPRVLTLQGGGSRVCWSPDGKRLASAAEDFAVKVWDAETGRQALALPGHTGPVTGVAWSPDGKRLASSSQDGTVKVWHAETGQEARTLQGHTGRVTGVCWSPDGKHLASAGSDKTVKVWEVRKAQETLPLGGAAFSVRWSPDGRRLAAASGDSTVAVWDADTGQQALVLPGHVGRVYSVCWSPDGKRLASAGQDSTARVWDAETGQQVLALRGHAGSVTSVCWSPDGRRLASASDDLTVRVWDVDRRQEVRRFEGHTDGISAVCWSPDGHYLASAGMDRTVWLWDAVRGGKVHTLRGHTGPVTGVCWRSDGQRLASSSGGFDDRGQPLPGEVKLWDADDGEEVLSLTGHTGPVYGVCWSPDGKRLATASDDQTVKVWEAAKGQEALTLKGHTGAVLSVCWSPDGQRLASAGFDQAVKVWEAE
jgi:WD40 repeat protein/serine/threonine protein kinase